MSSFLQWLLKPKTSGKSVADRWEQASNDLLRRLQATKAELLAVQERFNRLSAKLESISKRVESDLETAALLEKQHQSAMNALRAELEVAEDVLVPALSAAVKKVQGIWETDAAIEESRRLGAKVSRDNEM